jgi:hypothetical protein
MNARSLWDDCAQAMELTAEGNRLIALETAFQVRKVARAVMRLLDRAIRGHAIHRLPPI